MTKSTAKKRSRGPSKTKFPHVEKALAYARAVISGKIPAGLIVKRACQRHLNDLKRFSGRLAPYRFDPAKGERVCRFIELFPHVKGHWAIPQPGVPGATKIRLEPWQCFIVVVLFGWLERSTGFRRFRVAYIEVPRKNGKSVMAGGIGLYCFAADGEFGAEIYSGATSEKQAWEVFRPAKKMAEQTPAFRTQFGVKVNAKGMVILRDGSRFEPVIGKPGDGASPSTAIVDEYHEHPDSTLYDTMETGMAARQQPLMLVITTAGENLEGPCYDLHTQVEKALDGSEPNERLFGIIYSIDKNDDWTTELALKKANPNYNVSASGSILRDAQLRAIASSRQQGKFKTKHLDIWVTARDAWMNMEWWNRQADPELRAEQFAGEPCFIGVDLASKLDLVAIVRVFRRDIEEDVAIPGEDGEEDQVERQLVPHYYVFGRYYAPRMTVEDPEKRHYQGWAHDGFMTATDGPMPERIDMNRVIAELKDDVRVHGVEEVAFDEWQAVTVEKELSDAGMTLVAVTQNTKNFSDPMKEVEALVKSGKLHHDGNPCLAWQISNVTVREDANENIYPRKERKELKIDGPQAMIMALSRAIAHAGNRSIYETRGPVVFG